MNRIIVPRRRIPAGALRGYRGLGSFGDNCSVDASGIRVCTPAAPSVSSWQQPNIGKQPWTDAQKISASTRVNTALAGNSFLNRNISLFNPPADSIPVIATSIPFVNYPAPGANPVVVLTYTVQPGLMLVITRLAVVHIGGNPPDGSGNVVWSVQINGGGVEGLGYITSQVGTYAQPNEFVIMAIENDVVTVDVQVPTGEPPMPPGTQTAARFHGWTYPLVQATQVNATPSSGVLQ